MKPPAQTTATSAILKAMTRILRPLVRLSIRHQITLHPLVEELKRLLVQEAERAVRRSGGEPTDSGIHTLTGVHRKDVRRLRRATDEPTSRALDEESTGGRLVARWTADKRYVDARGRPRQLALRRTHASDPPAFEDLVNEISRQDVRPRAVLEEMIRLSVVRMEGDRVALNQEAFVPAEGFLEKLYYFGLNTGDHADAAVFNLAGDGPPMLERSVHYDGLTDRSIAELEAAMRTEGMRLLQRLNRCALTLQRRDQKANGAGRFNAGIYFYRGHSDDD